MSDTDIRRRVYQSRYNELIERKTDAEAQVREAHEDLDEIKEFLNSQNAIVVSAQEAIDQLRELAEIDGVELEG